jgi:short-subunit dehydrogenase
MKKQTILITGATAGLGRGLAIALAKRGHHVIATGRRLDALESLKTEASGQLDAFQLDVTNAESIENAKREVERLTNGYGVDVLVNNAGFGILAPFEMTTDAEMRSMFETNVFGLAAVTRAFIPQMRDRGEGRIVNVSSVGGRITLPFFGAYNATKYAVESISDALRVELHSFGIKVVLIEPGAVNTEFNSVAFASEALAGGSHTAVSSPYAEVIAKMGPMRNFVEKTASKRHGPRDRNAKPERALCLAGLQRARHLLQNDHAHATLGCRDRSRDGSPKSGVGQAIEESGNPRAPRVTNFKTHE